MGDVPDEVRRFAMEHLHSVDSLAILFLMHEHPGRVWTAESLAMALAIDRSVAAVRMKELVAADILSTVPPVGGVLFQYSPSTPALASIVDLLVRWYRVVPQTILALVKRIE